MRTNLDKTITSATSVLLVRALGFNSNFVKVEGYAADNAFTFGEGAIGETVMGVDGKQSIAFTPFESDFNIQLQPDSESLPYFQKVTNAIMANQETYPFEFSVELPAIRKRYSATGGLVSIPPGVSAGKVLNAVTYSFKIVITGVEDI